VKLEIPGRLPGLNEIIDAAKQGKGKYQPYAMMKEHYTTMIGWLAKKLPNFEKVALIITWYEPNEKRDPDNVQAGCKFILDGLVKAGTIPNDTRRYIKSITHIPELDRDNPRVEVEIQEIGA
jgi:Holliday junction resolvase RusA-like endonuclease